MRFFYFHGNLSSALGSIKAKMFLCQGEIDSRTTKTLNLKIRHNNFYAMDIFMQNITGMTTKQVLMFLYP